MAPSIVSGGADAEIRGGEFGADRDRGRRGVRQEDVPGGKDHPLIGRYDSAALTLYKQA